VSENDVVCMYDALCWLQSASCIIEAERWNDRNLSALLTVLSFLFLLPLYGPGPLMQLTINSDWASTRRFRGPHC
jgi:hypothetical protein